MPTSQTFFELKSKFRDRAEQRGLRMTNRQAHKLTAAWLAAHLHEVEAYHGLFSDETGETAVDLAISAWLKRQAVAA